MPVGDLRVLGGGRVRWRQGLFTKCLGVWSGLGSVGRGQGEDVGERGRGVKGTSRSRAVGECRIGKKLCHEGGRDEGGGAAVVSACGRQIS